MSNHIRIVMTGHGQGELFLNGNKIDGVLAFDVSAGIEKANAVKLEFIADSVDIDMADSTITKATCADADDNDAMDNQE